MTVRKVIINGRDQYVLYDSRGRIAGMARSRETLAKTTRFLT